MMKLNLNTLEVESFATVDIPWARGTVMGRQVTYENIFSCGGGRLTCDYTCYAHQNTCDPSCQDTECITACQGGGQLTRDCGGGGTGGGGGTTGDGGTGTDYIGCTNDCTTGMQTAT